MSTRRIAATSALWLAAAGAALVARRVPQVYPAALAMAAAVTGAVLVDDMLARRGDIWTAACLAALELDRQKAGALARPSTVTRLPV